MIPTSSRGLGSRESPNPPGGPPGRVRCEDTPEANHMALVTGQDPRGDRRQGLSHRGSSSELGAREPAFSLAPASAPGDSGWRGSSVLSQGSSLTPASVPTGFAGSLPISGGTACHWCFLKAPQDTRICARPHPHTHTPTPDRHQIRFPTLTPSLRVDALTSGSLPQPGGQPPPHPHPGLANPPRSLATHPGGPFTSTLTDTEPTLQLSRGHCPPRARPHHHP